MAWSHEDRHKFLRGLDDTESLLLVFYKYLLYVLIPSVTLLAIFFLVQFRTEHFNKVQIMAATARNTLSVFIVYAALSALPHP